MFRPWIALIFAVSLSGCEGGQTNGSSGDRAVDGYGSLTFGMSFDSAIALTGAQRFNPFALKKCLMDRALRGCHLSATDNTSTFTTVDGVPYTLTLSFNRLDKLTDIELSFDRESVMDPAERITSKDCLAIFRRSVDWVARDYGALSNPHPDEKPPLPMAKTAAGNGYWLSSSKGRNGYFADGRVPMANGRSIEVRSDFLTPGDETTCNVSVEFNDAPAVERWSLSPQEAQEYQSVTANVATPKSRYPYVTKDGVDITSEADERNWKKFGTTDPEGGE